MARKVTFILNASVGAPAALALEDIPEEIREEVEEIYAALKANPNGRMRAEFDTVEELRTYMAQVQAYCTQRPAGAIRFRKSPTRKLPETSMDFRVTDLQTENEATTAEIRAAIVKAGGNDGTPKPVAAPAFQSPATVAKKATTSRGRSK